MDNEKVCLCGLNKAQTAQFWIEKLLCFQFSSHLTTISSTAWMKWLESKRYIVQEQNSEFSNIRGQNKNKKTPNLQIVISNLGFLKRMWEWNQLMN